MGSLLPVHCGASLPKRQDKTRPDKTRLDPQSCICVRLRALKRPRAGPGMLGIRVSVMSWGMGGGCLSVLSEAVYHHMSCQSCNHPLPAHARLLLPRPTTAPRSTEQSQWVHALPCPLRRVHLIGVEPRPAAFPCLNHGANSGQSDQPRAIRVRRRLHPQARGTEWQVPWSNPSQSATDQIQMSPFGQHTT
jgi:hypothetical protein